MIYLIGFAKPDIMNNMEDFLDDIAGAIGLLLYFVSIFMPLAAIGAFIDKEYRIGVLFSLGSLASYAIARAIGNYFDLQKRNELR